jgi:hypothetical protein
MNAFANLLFPRRARVFSVGASLALGVAVSGSALAQSTSAGIFGHGPAGAEVVSINATGAQRHATINDKGRYAITPIAMGTYTVTLQSNGATVDTRRNVAMTVGRGAQVDFPCPNDNCAAQ